MESNRKFLWVGDGPIPQNVLEATRSMGSVHSYRPEEPLAHQLQGAALALINPNGYSNDPNWLAGMMSELNHSPAIGVFLLKPDSVRARQILNRHRGQFIHADLNSPPAMLCEHLANAAAIQPAIEDLHSELAEARRISSQTLRTIEGLDEEMRLAARLQRDFLPRRLPEVGNARFAVLYRPVSWVSGDIYDVVRLDETHVGFYVADVVGHGMPAALLTMFIKKALQTKRILGASYEIVAPNISLQELNIDICDQNLPSCQFCTAIYCVLNVQTRMLTYARGGHPEPIVLHPDGSTETLTGRGSLLGIFPEEDFELMQFELKPGDRLVLYTDGAEEALMSRAGLEKSSMAQLISKWSNLTREEMLLHINAALDFEGTRKKEEEDDVTLLIMDV